MQQLNFNHLYYFYVTAREGTIARAAELLHLTPQTISGQLSAFEDYLGMQLFDRKGKRLVLNDAGYSVFGYAEDIFALGQELQMSLNNPTLAQRVNFNVGIVDVIPKVLAFDMLFPTTNKEQDIRLSCREGSFDAMVADLALSRIDLILSDRPLAPGANVRAYSHLMGECGVTFFAAMENVETLAEKFPQSLSGQPFLLPGDHTSLSVSLLTWFEERHLRPNIIAEFDDSALMKYFGQAGTGIFCLPSIVENHIVEQYDVSIIGRTNELTEQFYAISPERKIKHPCTKDLLVFAKTLFEKY